MTDTSGQPPITTGEPQAAVTVPTATLTLEFRTPEGKRFSVSYGMLFTATDPWDNYQNLQRAAEGFIHSAFKKAFPK